MITLVLVSAALTAAAITTKRRATNRWVRDIAAMLALGFLGIFGVAVMGVLFGAPNTWAFGLVFAFGAGIEAGHIRRRRGDAVLLQQQVDAWLRDQEGRS